MVSYYGLEFHDAGPLAAHQIRGFKALKQMTKMNYLYRHQPEEALKTYRELLGYTKVSLHDCISFPYPFFVLPISAHR